MRRLNVPAIPLVALLAVFGCKGAPGNHDHGRGDHDHAAATSQPTANATINRMCPIMNEAVDPEAPTVGYKGHMIGFCCGDCVPEWNELSAAEKDEQLKKMLAR